MRLSFPHQALPISVSGEVSLNNRLQPVVSDRGRGMTDEQVESIGAFVQFDRSTYEQQGSGLGLVIAKRAAEVNGGALEIQSVGGEGLTAIVTLPTVRNLSSYL